MIKKTFQLWAAESGQDIAEYAVMLAVILVIVIGASALSVWALPGASICSFETMSDIPVSTGDSSAVQASSPRHRDEESYLLSGVLLKESSTKTSAPKQMKQEIMNTADFVNAFTAAMTHDDIDAVMKLWSPDGEWVVMATGETFKGLDKIRELATRSVAARTHGSGEGLLPFNVFTDAEGTKLIWEYVHKAVVTPITSSLRDRERLPLLVPGSIPIVYVPLLGR